MTDPLYKQMTAFLLGQGIEEMEHTGKTYLGHLIAVHRMMEEQACSTDACRAGLFHSIYGTAAFQRFQLPLNRRAEVRDLIGERAERLAYLNCAMDRASFDAALQRGQAPFQILDRGRGFRRPVPGAPVRLARAGAAVPLRLRVSPGGLPGDGGAAGTGRHRRLRSRLRGRARGDRLTDGLP